MDPEKKKFKHFISKKFKLEDIFIILTIILGIVLLINIIFTFNLNREFKKMQKQLMKSQSLQKLS